MNAEHWRGAALAAGTPATWRYILRCAQLLATLSTQCISRSVPSPSSRSAHARASPLFPSRPAPRHTHTQSLPNDHPFQHQVTTPDAHPDLFVRSLPVLSDGLGVCVGRSALSTTEPAEDPSHLSPPHAPTHIHVSTTHNSATCARVRCWQYRMSRTLP
jgi:hypothetical protein